jgi:pyridoxal phosphate enzyme (YggS family)
LAFSISQYNRIQNELLDKQVTLVAVSKTKPVADILEAYHAGIRDFGENYVQELCDKQRQLPSDIRWHFIGHLQSNKVKFIAPFVHLIHGVDSEKLLLEIQKQGLKNNRTIECLLQVHIAEEENKFGFDEHEIKIIAQKYGIEQPLSHVSLRGLMGMASFSADAQKIKAEFDLLKNIFDTIRSWEALNPVFDTLSMGMSSDYPLAIQSGSTLIRVGSILFGERS